MEEAFAQYLALGMTYKQYWYASPRLVCDYRKADQLKQDRYSQEAWLQGYYTYNAVAIAIANGFGGSKGKQAKYEPNLIVRFREKTKAEIAEEAEQKRLEIIKRLEQMGGGFNGGQDR